MANIYNFDDGDLQLSADKVAQFTSALATGEVAEPLQQKCDEAAADVARLTAGYVLDNDSIFNFIRSITVFKLYSASGSDVPPGTATEYKSAMDELTSISLGKRVNLPKQPDAALQSRAGSAGSRRRIHGRLGAGFGDGEGGWM